MDSQTLLVKIRSTLFVIYRQCCFFVGIGKRLEDSVQWPDDHHRDPEIDSKEKLYVSGDMTTGAADFVAGNKIEGDQIDANLEKAKHVAIGKDIRTVHTGDVAGNLSINIGNDPQDRPINIELIINRDFDQYSKADREKLLRAISELLGMSEDGIKITKMSQGSVHLSISLSQNQAIQLFNLFKTGRLEEHDVIEISFENANLSEAFLYRADLRWANLRRANLREAFLYKADLRGVDLRGADLRGANLSDARYDSYTIWSEDFDYRNSGAIGPNANLHGVNLCGVNLRGVDLRGADLREADLSETDLSGADLRQTNLRATNLNLAKFDIYTKWPDDFDYRNSGAIGPNANLHGVNLRGVNLRGVDLRGADLSEADLRGANLSDARYDSHTIWPGIFDYRNSGAIGPNANLSGVDLRAVDLRGVDLRGADLRRSRYDSQTKWPEDFDYRNSGAIGPNANLHGVNLHGVNLRGVDLRGADLSEADLSEADLSGADLRQTNLRATNLNLVKFDIYTKWPDDFDFVRSMIPISGR